MASQAKQRRAQDALQALGQEGDTEEVVWFGIVAPRIAEMFANSVNSLVFPIPGGP